jgi:hypothetical protein
VVNKEQIPETAAEFDAWYRANLNEWPTALRDAGQRVSLTLASLDQANASKSPAFMEASRKDLLAFAEAYADWAGQH